MMFWVETINFVFVFIYEQKNNILIKRVMFLNSPNQQKKTFKY